MKINDIIVEKQLDEIPAGGLGQMAKKIGSKVLNKVPGATAKSKAANLAGQADLGDTANNLHKEFNGYLGQLGKKISQASGEDFTAFLKTKKHNTSATIPSGVLNKHQLNDLLMTASKEALAGKGGMPAEPAASASGQAPAPKQKQAAAPKPSNPKAPAAIPKDISAQLSKMSPANKQKLAGMLQ